MKQIEQFPSALMRSLGYAYLAGSPINLFAEVFPQQQQQRMQRTRQITGAKATAIQPSTKTNCAIVTTAI